MIGRLLIFLFSFFIFIFGLRGISIATYDPLSIPNNKIGIHILFPSELQRAAELVNSSGGDWGYVIIPIQAGDKDIEKWQLFMDEARYYHLIPILRLATEGDYFDKTTWRKPKETDILDFANFLSSLEWPVKNRYIVVFNEVNRADEWEGQASPYEYASLLSYAVDVFKEKSPDFFIISSGLDNASITSKGNFSQYDFLRLMEEGSLGVFNKIDGFASHSYPNPGFSTQPNIKTRNGVASFLFEQETIFEISGRRLPVFITETNWTQEKFSDEVIGNYFKVALNGIWSDKSIVAITPFLLNAADGPFKQFSFLKENGEKNKIYDVYKSLQKTQGKPELYPVKLLNLFKSAFIPVKDFKKTKVSGEERTIKDIIKWIFFGL